MIFKKVYINFAIRLILITANIFLLVMGLFWEIESFTLINLAVLLIIQLFFLIYPAASQLVGVLIYQALYEHH